MVKSGTLLFDSLISCQVVNLSCFEPPHTLMNDDQVHCLQCELLASKLSVIKCAAVSNLISEDVSEMDEVESQT